MKRFARVVVMMIRPPVALVLMLFAALGVAVGGRVDGVSPLFSTVLPIVAGWFVNATVLNDLADEDIDRVNLANGRGRPLVSGQATRRQLLALGVAAGSVTLAAAWLVNRRVGGVVSVGLLLNVAYSLPPFRLSRRGLLAVIMLPLGYVVVPFLVGALAVGQDLGHNGGVILVGLYVTFMGRIVLKDFRDETGDRLFGKRTFLVRRGREDTCLLSAACWIAGCGALIAIAPFRAALIGVFAAYLICVLRGLYLLAKSRDPSVDQVIIGSIAQIGRGMAITLLAHLTMAAKGWTQGDQAIVQLSIAAAMVYLFLETVTRRHAVTAAEIRPY
jgi:4-hydroxybenzoate polyprenyltransferase